MIFMPVVKAAIFIVFIHIIIQRIYHPRTRGTVLHRIINGVRVFMILIVREKGQVNMLELWAVLGIQRRVGIDSPLKLIII